MIKSIIISGPPAIGKTTTAKGLAKEFNLQYLSGGDVLKQIAQEQGFDIEGDDWWDKPEGMKFLEQRKNNFEFDKQVDEKLKSLFLKGNVVITSYTLPWLVKGGIKIWLEGSKKSSAQRMNQRDDLPQEQTIQIVATRYQSNKQLYKKLYDFDFGDDLSVFDKVIDTNGLDASEVLTIAIKTVRELFQD